jgi:hypothetical protein
MVSSRTSAIDMDGTPFSFSFCSMSAVMTVLVFSRSNFPAGAAADAVKAARIAGTRRSSIFLFMVVPGSLGFQCPV